MNATATIRRGMGSPEAVMYGNMIPERVRRRAKDFFTYGVDFLPLAAGGTATQDFSVQNDSDFLIVAATAVVTDGATGLVFSANGPFLVAIADGGSGRLLQNQAAAFGNIYGTGQLPSYWPFPKMLNRASSVRTTLTNLDGANAFNVRVSYLGFKIFDFEEGAGG